MALTKYQKYQQLIEDFKKVDFHEFNGELLNPFGIAHSPSDSITHAHLNPWAHWHGNLDAQVVLIGQDWGGTEFFYEHGGKDPEGNHTNNDLRSLFQQMDIEIGTPSIPSSVPLYFTNAVLGIKEGEMAKGVKVRWYTSTLDSFLKRLIEDIIEPKVMITMGSVAFDAARRMYGIEKMKFTDAIGNGKIELPNGRLLFPVAHCSGLGKRNRPFETQMKDWKRMGEEIKQIPGLI